MSPTDPNSPVTSGECEKRHEKTLVAMKAVRVINFSLIALFIVIATCAVQISWAASRQSTENKQQLLVYQAGQTAKTESISASLIRIEADLKELRAELRKHPTHGGPE